MQSDTISVSVLCALSVYLSLIERVKSCWMKMSQPHTLPLKKLSFSSVYPSLFLSSSSSSSSLSKHAPHFLHPLDEYSLPNFSFLYLFIIFTFLPFFFLRQNFLQALSSLKHFPCDCFLPIHMSLPFYSTFIFFLLFIFAVIAPFSICICNV